MHHKNRLLQAVLTTLKDNFQPANIYMNHGHKMKGEVLHFDEQSVLIERNEYHYLLMFDAITSISYDANTDIAYKSQRFEEDTCNE